MYQHYFLRDRKWAAITTRNSVSGARQRWLWKPSEMKVDWLVMTNVKVTSFSSKHCDRSSGRHWCDLKSMAFLGTRRNSSKSPEGEGSLLHFITPSVQQREPPFWLCCDGYIARGVCCVGKRSRWSLAYPPLYKKGSEEKGESEKNTKKRGIYGIFYDSWRLCVCVGLSCLRARFYWETPHHKNWPIWHRIYIYGIGLSASGLEWIGDKGYVVSLEKNFELKAAEEEGLPFILFYIRVPLNVPQGYIHLAQQDKSRYIEKVLTLSIV